MSSHRIVFSVGVLALAVAALQAAEQTGQEAHGTSENGSGTSIVAAPAVAPRRNIRLHFYDDDFLFLSRNYGDRRDEGSNAEAGFFVHSNAHDRWLQILRVSTRGGRFGTSRSNDPEARKKLLRIPVTWDFTASSNQPYIDLPLKTSGSLAFPDRIEYEAQSNRYELRFFSKLEIDSAESVLYIPKDDLLAAFE